MANLTRAVFLDRDGTIIVDKGYVHRVEDLEFLPGSIDGLLQLQAMGFLLVIVTNQSGIARGMFTEADYQEFTRVMLDRLHGAGVHVDRVYHCPHLEGCSCRKPALGMYLQARDDLSINLDKSFAIGDKMRDLSLCAQHATTGFLLGDVPAEGWDCVADFAGKVVSVPDLAEAANRIASMEGEAYGS